jgi:hypothetical protein
VKTKITSIVIITLFGCKADEGPYFKPKSGGLGGPSYALKCIVTAQEQFKSYKVLDVDSDEIGEYGFLQELGSHKYIGRQIANVDSNGVSNSHSGYFTVLYIPGKSKAVLVESKGEIPPNSEIDIDLKEEHYIVYSWPVNKQVSNIIVVIRKDGQPYFSYPSKYYGKENIPPWHEALPNGPNSNWSDDYKEGWEPSGW